MYKSQDGLFYFQTKTVLGLLIKHNLVDFRLDAKKEFVLYSLKLQNVLAIVRHDRYMNAIKSLYDGEAELIVEQMLSNGNMTLANIITSVAENLSDRSSCKLTVMDSIKCLLIVYVYVIMVQVVGSNFTKACQK